MAAASLDVNFKEELSAIEQCKYLFKPFTLRFILTFVSSRVQSLVGSGAHSRSLQSSSTLHPGPDSFFHYRSPANG
jgi:hypothetical protein